MVDRVSLRLDVDEKVIPSSSVLDLTKYPTRESKASAQRSRGGLAGNFPNLPMQRQQTTPAQGFQGSQQPYNPGSYEAGAKPTFNSTLNAPSLQQQSSLTAQGTFTSDLGGLDRSSPTAQGDFNADFGSIDRAGSLTAQGDFNADFGGIDRGGISPFSTLERAQGQQGSSQFLGTNPFAQASSDLSYATQNNLSLSPPTSEGDLAYATQTNTAINYGGGGLSLYGLNTYFETAIISNTYDGSDPPPPASPNPPDISGDYIYNSSVASLVAITGSGVGTLYEFSGGLSFTQGTDSSRPGYDSTWLQFYGNKYLQMASAGEFDFFHQAGGTMVYIVKMTGSWASSKSGYLYSTVFNVGSYGSEIRLFASADATTVRFSPYVQSGFTGQSVNSKNYSNSAATHLVIARYVSGTVSGVPQSNNLGVRVNGEDQWTAWSSWASNTTVAEPKLGVKDNLTSYLNGAEIVLAVFMPTVITDAQCVNIENWAVDNYSVVLSSSV